MSKQENQKWIKKWLSKSSSISSSSSSSSSKEEEEKDWEFTEIQVKYPTIDNLGCPYTSQLESQILINQNTSYAQEWYDWVDKEVTQKWESLTGSHLQDKDLEIDKLTLEFVQIQKEIVQKPPREAFLKRAIICLKPWKEFHEYMGDYEEMVQLTTDRLEMENF